MDGSLYVPLSKSDEKLRAHKIITGGPPAAGLHVVKCITSTADAGGKRCKRSMALFNTAIFWSVKQVTISGKPVATSGRPGYLV